MLLKPKGLKRKKNRILALPRDKFFFYSIVVKVKTTRQDVFTYKSKLNLPEGIIVEVDFRKRKVLGFILKKIKNPPYPLHKIKQIKKVIDYTAFLDKKRINLAKFASDFYSTSLGKVIFWGLPEIAKRKTQKEPLKVFKKIKTPKQKPKKPIFFQADLFNRYKIYKTLSKKELKKNKQVLLIAPNLNHWLPQKLAQELKGQILSPKLSRTQEYLFFRKALKSQSGLYIGSQKALFLPLSNLSLIIIEDVANTNFKQEQDPKIDARILAKKFAKIIDCPLILAGLTPDPETYLEIKNKKIVSKKQLQKPKVQIIDLLKENKLIGFATNQAIEKYLKQNKSVIIFHNRLGFFKLFICEDCGLAVHQKESILAPALCPLCQSPKIKMKSFGLERLAYDIKKLFPDQKITLLFKSARTKPEKINVASSFAFRFEKKFNLSIISLLEIGLSLPDPKIAFKVFHFAIEALSMGRYGIIQTFIPQHYLTKAVQKMDYDLFFKNWLLLRKKLGLSPFNKEIKISFKTPKKQEEKEIIIEKIKQIGSVRKIYELKNLKGENYLLVLVPKTEKMPPELKTILFSSSLKIEIEPKNY